MLVVKNQPANEGDITDAGLIPGLVGRRGYLVAAGRLLIAVASLVNTGDSGFSSCYIG